MNAQTVARNYQNIRGNNVREYKFRAWDNYHQEMINWDQYKDELVSDDFINHGQGPLVVMQYTGIKDDNGKEIYEGDIVEGGHFSPLSKEFYSKLYEVTFKEGNYMAKLIGYSPYGDTFLRFIEGVVIGNIYENKELLKGEE